MSGVPSRLRRVWPWLAVMLAGVLVATLLRWLVLGVYKVPSGSMEPTIGDPTRVLAIKHQTPRRGDVVVFRDQQGWSNSTRTLLVKRLLGVPGDVVDVVDGRLSVNGIEVDESWAGPTPDFDVVVGPHQLFFAGDNRPHSLDARCFIAEGREFVDTSQVVGVVRWVQHSGGPLHVQALRDIPTRTGAVLPRGIGTGGC